mmetsp:Transcript_43106/g.113536  ORF Transcript_43106/g.113536 Transcript_43106/m.113536 type:complete len:205 (-) Transcript_43106:75-689(-)
MRLVLQRVARVVPLPHLLQVPPELLRACCIQPHRHVHPGSAVVLSQLAQQLFLLSSFQELSAPFLGHARLRDLPLLRSVELPLSQVLRHRAQVIAARPSQNPTARSTPILKAASPTRAASLPEVGIHTIRCVDHLWRSPEVVGWSAVNDVAADAKARGNEGWWLCSASGAKLVFLQLASQCLIRIQALGIVSRSLGAPTAHDRG